MGVVCHHQMITTDASLSGWGAVFEGRPACRVWSGKYLAWHINGLELRAVHLALTHFLPFLAHTHVIVRTDNMAVVSHINRQGGSRSRTLNRHARQLLLWAQDKFLSLRAARVSGVLNLAADFLSRQKLRSGEWMLNRQTVDQIWERFGVAEVDLFAFQESAQCPLWFSLSHPTSLGIDAQASFPSGQAHPSGIVQGEDMRSPPSPSSPVLAFPDVVLGVGLSSGGRSVEDSSQERPTVSVSGQNLASTSRDLEVVGMADHRSPLAFDLSDGVRETINSARALSTRKLYSSKWRVFKSWCLVHAVDPVNCPVGSVLEFLAAATTLRVYVAARRDSDDVPLGRHRLVSSFMRGVKCLRPVRPPSFPSWDLSVVLKGLLEPPFEPLESAPVRILTLKVTLLLALASLKRVGDLQALSVSKSYTEFAPGLVKAFLRPRPGYVPKVLSTSFRSQVVVLQAFSPSSSSEGDDLHLLCPVRALKMYVDRSSQWRKSLQMSVCFGAGRKGLATSKHTISHWVRDAISLAYEVRSLPSPLDIRAYSTRGVASSQALFRGVPLEDICMAAGWSSPHTFVRFYNLNVNTAPGSQVLSV